MKRSHATNNRFFASELGLHPVAIQKLTGMIRSAASKDTQVIVATQSADLLSHFNPKEVITVNQCDGST